VVWFNISMNCLPSVAGLRFRVLFGAAVSATTIWRRPFGAGLFRHYPSWRWAVLAPVSRLKDWQVGVTKMDRNNDEVLMYIVIETSTSQIFCGASESKCFAMFRIRWSTLLEFLIQSFPTNQLLIANIVSFTLIEKKSVVLNLNSFLLLHLSQT